MIWASFQSFGHNMWSDVPVSSWGRNNGEDPEGLSEICAADSFRFDEKLWRRLTARLRETGVDTIVMDVGEGLVYPSHPELGVRGSWSAERLNAEVKRLAAMGFRVVPKLNFSTSHDTWLKDYGRMVSSRVYYRVVQDVLGDVYEVFDRPEYIHLGYDEETHSNQTKYSMSIVRNGELWWRDFFFIAGVVEKLGARAWIWADYCWHHKEEFLRRMPKSVLLSNWYYGAEFDIAKLKSAYHRPQLQAFFDLDKAGFEQVPCGSSINTDANFPGLVRFSRENITPSLLKGFMMAAWCGPTVERNAARHLHAADIIAGARTMT